jgi:hypothetical protein
MQKENNSGRLTNKRIAQLKIWVEAEERMKEMDFDMVTTNASRSVASCNLVLYNIDGHLGGTSVDFCTRLEGAMFQVTARFIFTSVATPESRKAGAVSRQDRRRLRTYR